MLGQPMSMLIPQVLGFKLSGELPEGATATDLVLTVTQMLRERGVVGKFVEFFGPGVAALPLADRATIGNMSPEFGSTCAIFPIDAETLRYLEFSGRPQERIELVEAYAKEQGLWHDEDSEEPTYSDTLELDLVRRRALARRPEAPAGPRLADGVQGRLPARARGPAARRRRGPEGGRARPGRGERRLLPGLGPAVLRRPQRPRRALARSAAAATAGPAACRSPSASRSSVPRHARGRHGDRARPRPRRDRRDHLVHQHLQPVGHARRRPARPQRGGQGPEVQAVGEDLARARARRSSPSTSSAPGSPRTSRRSASTSSATAARPASATPGRCRRRSPTSSRPRTSRSSRCSRATATSRAASTPT